MYKSQNNLFSKIIFTQIFNSYEEANDYCNQIIQNIDGLEEQYQRYYTKYITPISQNFEYNCDKTPFQKESFKNFINNKISQLLEYCSLSIYSTPFIHSYYKLYLLSLEEDKMNSNKGTLKALLQRQPLVNCEQLYKCFFQKPIEDIKEYQKFNEYIQEFNQLQNFDDYFKLEQKYFQDRQYLNCRIQFISCYLSFKYPEKANLCSFIVLNQPQASIYWTQNFIQQQNKNNRKQINMFQTYQTILHNKLSSDNYIILSKAFQILNRQQTQLQLEYQLYQQDNGMRTCLYLLNSAIIRNNTQQIDNIIDTLLQFENNNQQSYLELICNQFVINDAQFNNKLANQILRYCPYSIVRKLINVNNEQNLQYQQLQNIIFEILYYNNISQDDIDNINRLFQQLQIQQQLHLSSLLLYPNNNYKICESEEQLIIPQQLQQYFYQENNLYVKVKKQFPIIENTQNFKQQVDQSTYEFPPYYTKLIKDFLTKIQQTKVFKEQWKNNLYEINSGRPETKQIDSELALWLQLINLQL